MSSFNTAHGKTAINEGGFTLVREDNGNWTSGSVGTGTLVGTNYGISAPVLADYLNRRITREDMENLSPDVAKKIYKRLYWDKIKGDEINNQDTANSIYDSAVNMGVGTAIKMAQRALRIKETGVMDIETLNKLNNK